MVGWKNEAFERDTIEGTLTLKVLMDTKWWDIHNTEVVSEAKAAT